MLDHPIQQWSDLIVLKFELTETGVRVDQWCTPPTIYFDHWAWGQFSEAPALLERFVHALKHRGGTLAISWLNLVEFSRMTDPRQAHQADELLDAILPNIFFIQPDYFKVIEEEDKLLRGEVPTIAPHADVGLLRYWAILALKDKTSLKLMTAQDLHRLAQGTGIAAKYGPFADGLINAIEQLRIEFQSDPEFRNRVNRLPSGPPVQFGTRFIRNELLRSVLVNKTLKLTRNHVIDLSHAIVPAAYCDFLLLDKHWKRQTEIARDRIRSAGLSFPFSEVISAKEIETFLSRLETETSRS